MKRNSSMPARSGIMPVHLIRSRSHSSSPATATGRTSQALLLSLILTLACSIQYCGAREWTDVINVRRVDRGDRYRWQQKFEIDPFLEDGETSAPVAAPTFAVVTESPTVDIVDIGDPTRPDSGTPSGDGDDVITSEPTADDLVFGSTVAPTSAPTDRAMNIDGNGGCPNGEFLMALFMYDGGSDGWDDTRLALLYENFKIQQFAYKGGLEDGASGIEYICLRPNMCYTAVVDGTVWLNEISWEIRPVVLGKQGTYKWAVAKGRAPADCQFSFGNQGSPVCESTCLSWDPVKTTPKPTAKPTRAPTRRANAPPAPVPVPAPAPAPTMKQTPRPTKAPTRAPTEILATRNPSPGPTLLDDFGMRKNLR
mmetsp:Transcript_9931/g.22203  ORF Transcript_9931/g.22203 Transcript_9931/m.22203 type:complete len:367 (+) Transcript_9931:136-1236(+)